MSNKRRGAENSRIENIKLSWIQMAESGRSLSRCSESWVGLASSVRCEVIRTLGPDMDHLVTEYRWQCDQSHRAPWACHLTLCSHCVPVSLVTLYLLQMLEAKREARPALCGLAAPTISFGQTQKLWNMRKCELVDTGHWAGCDTGSRCSVQPARGCRQADSSTDALIFSHFIVTDILNLKPDSVLSLRQSEYIPASRSGARPRHPCVPKLCSIRRQQAAAPGAWAVTRAGIRPPC